MDLSSSATQRSLPSEALSIQPGSVRAATAVAANEFARHLAENARTDAPRRRDDRPAERPSERSDNAPESTREARDDRDSKTARRNEERETAVNGPALAQTMETGNALAIGEAETTLETDGANEGTTLGMNTGEAAPEAPESTIATGADGEPTTTTPATLETAETTAPEEAGDNIAQNGTEVGSETELAPQETNAQAPTAAAILPQASAADATATDMKPGGQVLPDEKGIQPAANRPADILAASGDAEADAPEAAPANAVKPAKGLGQEAAEQLASKKADAKQAAEAPKAAQAQAAPSQPQQAAAAAPLAPFMAAMGEGGNTARGGDLMTGAIPASSSATSTGATVRIGTLPGQSQPTQVPAATIALQMARNLQKGMSRFEIRLDPPEMGRIDVRMEIRKDGHVVAHMSVERPETLDLLQRDARALQQALNNAGLQADSDSLNFSLKDQNGDTPEQHLAGRGSSNSGMADEGDDAPTLPVYNVNLALNGGVDIRI